MPTGPWESQTLIEKYLLRESIIIIAADKKTTWQGIIIVVTSIRIFLVKLNDDAIST